MNTLECLGLSPLQLSLRLWTVVLLSQEQVVSLAYHHPSCLL